MLKNYIESLHPNKVSFLITLIQSIATIFTAWVAVKTAFEQIRRNFEQKIIYEGWKNLQEKIFDFSEASSNYSIKILELKFFLDNQDNPKFNGGDKKRYRFEKWLELANVYSKLRETYTEFLIAFESHEILFLPLINMKNLFVKEFDEKIHNINLDLLKKVFPEIYGFKKKYNSKKLKGIIDSYWEKTSEIGSYLYDFRIELQDETLGKILNKRLEYRKPSKDYKILTRKGFFIQA